VTIKSLLSVGDRNADHVVADGALLLAALEMVEVFGFADGCEVAFGI
jgi:hypothetical protein